MKYFPSRTIPDKHRCRKGMTLVEVMLGMLILAILVVGATTGLKHPRYLVFSAVHKQSAIHAANEALEEVVSIGYDKLTIGVEPLNDLGDRYSMNGQAVSVTRTVEAWNGESPPILWVTISVVYPGGDTPVILETLISP